MLPYRDGSKALLLMVFICLVTASSGQLTGSSHRTVPPAVVDSFRKDKNYAYANDPAYWKKKSQVQGRDSMALFVKILKSPAIRWIVYLVLFSIFVFVVYRILFVLGLFDSNTGNRRRNEKHELETMAQTDLNKMLEQAKQEGDLRLAVRYQYLLLLKKLSDNKLVQLHARATNHDYILQLEQTRYAEQFRFLTRVYEYVWYGERQVDELQYERLQQTFAQLKSRLPN